MTEGIGARVKRKEDKRFTTGVRSPYAHAKVTKIDSAAAEAMEGVLAVLNGAELTGDGIGNLICGWAINSKDGSPMNMGAWSALATEKTRYVGDAVAVVIADSEKVARNAAEAVDVTYQELQSDFRLGNRRWCRHGCGDQGGKTRHFD